VDLGIVDFLGTYEEYLEKYPLPELTAAKNKG